MRNSASTMPTGPVTPAPEQSSESAMTANVRNRAISGSFWVMGQFFASQIVRMAGNLILTRLLFTEAFGLMILVNTVIQGLMLFSDVGLNQSIIQNRAGDRKQFLNTAWTMQVGRGLVLWIAACALAYPVAWFYGQPELAMLIPVASLVAIITGFESTNLATATRHLAYARQSLLLLGSQCAGLAVMIVLAYQFRSVWALIIGAMAAAVIKSIGTHGMLPGIRNRFAWDPEAVRAIIDFGKWILLSSALTFLAMQIDKLILGKLVSIQVLGALSIALFITEAPRALIRNLGGKIIFPAVARKADIPRHELREKIAINRLPILALMLLLVAGLTTCGDLLVRALWDWRYAEASWVTPILAAGLWPAAMFGTIGPALRSLGKPSYNALGSIGRLVWIICLVPFANQQAGLLGLMIVFASADIPNYVAANVGLHREKMTMWRQDALASLALLVVIAVAIAARLFFGLGWPMSTNF